MLQPPGASHSRVTQQHTRKKAAESPDDLIRKLQRLPANKKCCDCSSKLPSNVNLTVGIFLCSTCAGIHRELNQRIKGVGHSSFTAEEAEFMQSVDNDIINSMYLAGFDPKFERLKQPMDNSNQQLLRTWIVRKYRDKSWYRISNTPVQNEVKSAKAPPQATVVQIPPKKEVEVDLFGGFSNHDAPPQQQWDAFSGQTNVVEQSSFQADFGNFDNPVPDPPKPKDDMFPADFGSSQFKQSFQQSSVVTSSGPEQTFQANFADFSMNQSPQLSQQQTQIHSMESTKSVDPNQKQDAGLMDNFSNLSMNQSTQRGQPQMLQSMEDPNQKNSGMPYQNSYNGLQQNSLQFQPTFPTFQDQQSQPQSGLSHPQQPGSHSFFGAQQQSTNQFDQQTIPSFQPNFPSQGQPSSMGFDQPMNGTQQNMSSSDSHGQTSPMVSEQPMTGGFQPENKGPPFSQVGVESVQSQNLGHMQPPQNSSFGSHSVPVNDPFQSLQNNGQQTMNQGMSSFNTQQYPTPKTLPNDQTAPNMNGAQGFEHQISSQVYPPQETGGQSSSPDRRGLSAVQSSGFMGSSVPGTTMNAIASAGLATVPNVSSMEKTGSSTKFKEGQKVFYRSSTYCGDAEIMKVHLDDELKPFYTISVNGKEKQTDDSHLSVETPLRQEVLQMITAMTEDELANVKEFITRQVKTADNINSANHVASSSNAHGTFHVQRKSVDVVSSLTLNQPPSSAGAFSEQAHEDFASANARSIYAPHTSTMTSGQVVQSDSSQSGIILEGENKQLQGFSSVNTVISSNITPDPFDGIPSPSTITKGVVAAENSSSVAFPSIQSNVGQFPSTPNSHPHHVNGQSYQVQQPTQHALASNTVTETPKGNPFDFY